MMIELPIPIVVVATSLIATLGMAVGMAISVRAAHKVLDDGVDRWKEGEKRTRDHYEETLRLFEKVHESQCVKLAKIKAVLEEE